MDDVSFKTDNAANIIKKSDIIISMQVINDMQHKQIINLQF